MSIQHFSKSGPKTKARQIEPSAFMGRTPPASVGQRQKLVGKATQKTEGPFILWALYNVREGFYQPFGGPVSAAIGKYNVYLRHGLVHVGFFKYLPVGYRNLLSRIPKLKLKSPAVIRPGRSAP